MMLPTTDHVNKYMFKQVLGTPGRRFGREESERAVARP